jgi:hypothetical protein
VVSTGFLNFPASLPMIRRVEQKVQECNPEIVVSLLARTAATRKNSSNPAQLLKKGSFKLRHLKE